MSAAADFTIVRMDVGMVICCPPLTRLYLFLALTITVAVGAVVHDFVLMAGIDDKLAGVPLAPRRCRRRASLGHPFVNSDAG